MKPGTFTILMLVLAAAIALLAFTGSGQKANIPETAGQDCGAGASCLQDPGNLILEAVSRGVIGLVQ